MISVIIPVYDQADKIGRTLDSIINQTERPLEVIVVNDGSHDEIGPVLVAYEDKLKQAQIPYQHFDQENKGAPAARNRGLAAASGDYLFFCDADAVLIPTALTTLKQALMNDPEASYAYPSFLWGRRLFRVGPWSAERLRQGPCIHTMALIRRADLPASGWDEAIKKLQDWDLWLTMLEAGKRGIWVEEVLFTVSPGGHISNWLPSFAYKLLPFLPQVKKYKRAVAIMKQKHRL